MSIFHKDVTRSNPQETPRSDSYTISPAQHKHIERTPFFFPLGRLPTTNLLYIVDRTSTGSTEEGKDVPNGEAEVLKQHETVEMQGVIDEPTNVVGYSSGQYCLLCAECQKTLLVWYLLVLAKI